MSYEAGHLGSTPNYSQSPPSTNGQGVWGNVNRAYCPEMEDLEFGIIAFRSFSLGKGVCLLGGTTPSLRHYPSRLSASHFRARDRPSGGFDEARQTSNRPNVSNPTLAILGCLAVTACACRFGFCQM